MDVHPQRLIFIGLSLLMAMLLSLTPLSGTLIWLRRIGCCWS